MPARRRTMKCKGVDSTSATPRNCLNGPGSSASLPTNPSYARFAYENPQSLRPSSTDSRLLTAPSLLITSTTTPGLPACRVFASARPMTSKSPPLLPTPMRIEVGGASGTSPSAHPIHAVSMPTANTAAIACRLNAIVGPTLPVQLQPQLHLARRIGLRADLAERRAAEVDIGRAPDDAIKQVECFQAHVEGHAAALEGFRDADVLVEIPRP